LGRHRNLRSAANIREKVRDAYSGAAESPQGKHAFPVGRVFAESLGYPRELLAGLPGFVAEAFTGVSNVSVRAARPEGAAVLDVGCGAGLDALVAARRAGPTGRVIGVDFSRSMLSLARRAANEAGLSRVLFCEAAAENLPLADASIDVALVNGIFNLNPAREAIFRELARVIRSGGALFAAELIVSEPLPAEMCPSEDNWFA
jgi:arsenite methyltransferase